MTETIEITDNIEHGATPGQLLQEARLVAGMTESEVARRLNLRVQMVRDLEADNYGSGAASTYTKGYLKAYARLMRLPDATIMDAYRRLQLREPEAAKMQSYSQRTRKEASHSRLMWLTYAIILVIVVMFVLWWLQVDNTVGTQEPAAVTESTEPQETSGLQPLPAATVTGPEPVVAEMAPLSSQEAPAQNLQIEPEPPQPVEEDAALDNVAETSAVAPEEVSEPTPPNAPGLVISFSGDCWVKVTDAGGEILLNGLRKAGTVANLDGSPPFKVILGAPQVVQVTYGGEPFDLSRFRSGKPARFQLPERG